MRAGAARSQRSNLPVELTSFIGRRRELREVKRLLTTTRLLTLIGSGGVGKTRLALRAAAEMARGFPDGAWFVSLAPIRDPLLVSQAVFTALDALDSSTGWSLAALTDYLAGRRLLLVLDNCEHLLDASATLTRALLTSCPHLHVLATSRQALDVMGEVRMPIAPMALPNEAEQRSLDLVLKSEAVSLLGERASAVVPEFAVNRSNATEVVELCRRLDGIPLALELAARRLGALSVEQLNQELARELSNLGGGNRGAEARQQTLEATIAWSHDLLEELERLLWHRLSVFAGGFDADAAIAVCSDDRLQPDRIVHLLGVLVEQSIVNRDLKAGNAPRYWMLETIRQYGRQRLRGAGEENSTQARHLVWIAGLARSVGAFDRRQVELFERMDRERDNLWGALEFCLANPENAELAAEIAQGLTAYWTCRGPFGDVRRVLTSLAERIPDDSGSRAHLLRAAAVMANSQNDFEAAVSMCRESLSTATKQHDSQAVAWSLGWLGIPLAITGGVAEAIEVAEAAASLARELPNQSIELVATTVLCNLLPMAGEPDKAIKLAERGLAISRECGEVWARGYLLMASAQAHWQRGENHLGEEQARDGVAAKHALNDRAGLQAHLEVLAWMAAEGGAHQRAATLLGCAEAVRRASAVLFLEGYRQQHERSMALALGRLGQKQFDVSYDHGLAMTLDDMVSFAVDDKPSARPVDHKTTSRLPLTRRELEIARLIADEMNSREIATKLFISERTVETHVTNIFNKLGLNSRVQLRRWLADVDEGGQR